MGLTQEDVLQILRIMEESDFKQLHLEFGEFKLDVNKSGNALSVSSPADLMKIEDKTPQNDHKTESSLGKEDMAKEEMTSEGLTPIRSPMLGTIYTSPKPEHPPFVEPGQVVEKDTTVCIIEVMKLFSTIHAGMRGRIVKVCATDGQMVEFDQILFLIEPITDAEKS